MLLIGGLIIKLSQGPISLNFAKDYIENTLSSPEKGYGVTINHVKLVWSLFQAPLLLDLGQVQVSKTKEESDLPDLSIDKVSIGLSGSNLLQGQLFNLSIVINEPRIELPQQQKLEILKTNSEESQNIDLTEDTKDFREKIIEFLETLSDPQYQETKIAALFKEINIKDAVLVRERKEVGENEGEKKYLALVNLKLRRHNDGIEGDLDVILPGESDRKASLKANLLYRSTQKDFTFTSYIKDVNPAHFSSFLPDLKILEGQDLFLEGELLTAFDQNLNLENASLSLRIPKGEIVIKEEYDAPLIIENFVLEADFNHEENKLNISDMSAIIGNIPFQLKTEATIQNGTIIAPIEAKIETLQMSDASRLIPKSQKDSSLGVWLTQGLKDGVVKDIIVSTTLKNTADSITGKRTFSAQDTTLSFAAEGLTVQYSHTLMPVTDIIGTGVYKEDVLTITGESARIGDVQAKEIKVILNDLTADGKGDADISLKAQGSLKTVFDYISDEPIAMGDDFGFDSQNAKGQANFDLQLKFPLLKDLPKEEVVVIVDGTIQNLFLPDIVKGLPLSGEKFDLSYKDSTISLKGEGQFDGHPIAVDFIQYTSDIGKYYETKIEASLVTDQALRKKFGINLDEYITGALPITLVYKEKNRKSTIDIKGDLTPTILTLSPFYYKKPSQIAGNLSLKAHLEKGELTEIDNLFISTKGLKFSKGRLLFSPAQGGGVDLQRGKINNVLLGKTNVALDFEIIQNKMVKIIAKGAVFDVSPFMRNSKTQSNKAVQNASLPSNDNFPMEISIKAGKVLLEKGKAFQNAKIYAELDSQSDLTRIELDSFAGSGAMYIRFKPNKKTGDRTFLLEAEDAGATLDILGVYSNIRGGKLLIKGKPRQGDETGDLSGKANITDFKVVKAPALAKLLDAMTMQGVQKFLREDGISFSKFESDFEWRFRKNGNLLVVKNGRSTGSAVGLTFEGLLDQQEKKIDISGTVIPLSNVNEALKNIPILGSILGGKDGALFAATYALKGNLSDPKVTINPLSVLAPGFLRKILFEDSVEQKLHKKEQK